MPHRGLQGGACGISDVYANSLGGGLSIGIGAQVVGGETAIHSRAISSRPAILSIWRSMATGFFRMTSNRHGDL